jgi:archaemetzincin
MQIIIQHIPRSSFELEYITHSGNSNSMVYSLKLHLSEIFGGVANINNSSSLLSSPFLIPTTTTIPPSYLYDERRKQWISNKILEWLLQNYNPGSNTKFLAMFDFDAYSGNLNFVLGEAHLGGRDAAIYLSRLRQEFYSKNADTSSLFEQRVIKESVHELGHTFGLNHCEKGKCVMHFSNSLRDTDVKHHRFCERCNNILKGQAT